VEPKDTGRGKNSASIERTLDPEKKKKKRVEEHWDTQLRKKRFKRGIGGEKKAWSEWGGGGVGCKVEKKRGWEKGTEKKSSGGAVGKCNKHERKKMRGLI